MLAAILNGKRRGTGIAGKQMAMGDMSGAEDVLTATVFERLAYLPDINFATFLDELLELDEPVGTLEAVTFWPSWSLDGQRIEPDVVLNGSMRTLLVEAKRSDNAHQQYASQLARELQAGWEGDELGNFPVLLTIGGLSNYSEAAACNLREEIDKKLGTGAREYELVCRSWDQLFQALQVAIVNSDSKSARGINRLVDDIANAYEWHGLRAHPTRWLTDLKSTDITASKFPTTFHRIENSVEATFKICNIKPLFDLQALGITIETFPINTWSAA